MSALKVIGGIIVVSIVASNIGSYVATRRSSKRLEAAAANNAVRRASEVKGE